jgi:hypothetical protein
MLRINEAAAGADRVPEILPANRRKRRCSRR